MTVVDIRPFARLTDAELDTRVETLRAVYLRLEANGGQHLTAAGRREIAAAQNAWWTARKAQMLRRAGKEDR